MQAAQYPHRKCREGIFNDSGIAYTCELQDLHPGPHATFSVASSVAERDRYEKDNPDWADHMHSADDDL